MKIERISMRNFKCFEAKTLELDACFTLIVGDNGSGKTSVLDALAIAAGIWLARLPDDVLVNSRRSILGKEIRVVANGAGDRVQFIQCKPVVIEAEGEICGRPVSWRRQIRVEGTRTTNADAQEAVRIISDHYERIRNGEDAISPVLAYYGAGRSWLPARQRGIRRGKVGPARRWDAFYDCFEERGSTDRGHRPLFGLGRRPGQFRHMRWSDARSVRDAVAEEVQGIAVPQRSARAEEFTAATKHYFGLLRAPSGTVSQEELSRAEADYRLAAERYSENPGLY